MKVFRRKKRLGLTYSAEHSGDVVRDIDLEEEKGRKGMAKKTEQQDWMRSEHAPKSSHDDWSLCQQEHGEPMAEL